MAHPPAPPLVVGEADMAVLQGVVRATTSEQRAVTRARIVLRSAEGGPIGGIAAELGVAVMTVKLWRRRYAESGLAGVADAPRPGHPPTYTREDRDRLVALTMGPPPDGTTHWSVRRMARRAGMSPSTVHRIWKELGYRPHRTETFKFSTDPALEAKVRDVVGLYLDPPDGAIVLSVDEKTQIQALDRTQPLLPMRPGQVERHTHDYTRRAARPACSRRSRWAPAPSPRRRANGTPGQTSWASCGGWSGPIRGSSCTSSSTTCPPTRRRPSAPGSNGIRGSPSTIPTSASWMNQVEIWFGILTRQAIRRGSFRSVRDLVAMIDAFTRQWNDGSRPFTREFLDFMNEVLAAHPDPALEVHVVLDNLNTHKPKHDRWLPQACRARRGEPYLAPPGA